VLSKDFMAKNLRFMGPSGVVLCKIKAEQREGIISSRFCWRNSGGCLC